MSYPSFNYKLNADVGINRIINSVGYPEDGSFYVIYPSDTSNKGYVVNPLNKNRILKSIKEGEIQEFGTGSDRDFVAKIKKNKSNKIKISYIAYSDIKHGGQDAEILEKRKAGVPEEVIRKEYKLGVDDLDKSGQFKPLETRSKSIKYIKKKRHSGAFFPYYCKLPIDLSRYGIFTNIENINSITEEEKRKIYKERYSLNCLQRAFKVGGMEEKDILYTTQFINNQKIPIKDFNELCKKLKICIKLTNFDAKQNRRSPKPYGNIKNKIYEIGLISGHFFLNDRSVVLQNYAIENHNEIIENIKIMKIMKRKVNMTWNEVKCFKAKGKNYIRYDKSKKPCKAGEILKCLLRNKDKVLEKIDCSNGLMKIPFYNNNNKEITNLRYRSCNLRKCEYKKKKELNELNEFEEYDEYKKKVDKWVDFEIEIPKKTIENGISEVKLKKLKIKYIFREKCTKGIDNIPDKLCIYLDKKIKILKNDKYVDKEMNFNLYNLLAKKINYDIQGIKLIGHNFETYQNRVKYENKIFFDFETYGKKYPKMKLIKGKWKKINVKCHTPFMCCSIDKYNFEHKPFIGDNCALQFLRTIRSDSILIAHNLGFDMRFLIPYIDDLKIIDKGNSIFEAKGKFYNTKLRKFINLKIKDSLQLIPKPLRDFGKCFGLKQSKEIMPYGAYNSKTIYKKYMTIEYAKKFLKKKEYEKFEKNIDIWGLRINKIYFNHMKYSEIYCKLDCKVLKGGYDKFRSWMLQITDIDIDDMVTICSLSHNYLKKEGCYKGILELSGVPREFIQKCVVGGRVMTRYNKKYHVKSCYHPSSGKYTEGKSNDKNILQDFDAVSLYPSAMIRMKGFLKGSPKVIEDMSYNKIKNYDGYFVELDIKNIPKKRAFPLISQVDDNGIRKFSNYIRGKVYLDNIGLEDLIKFHNLVPDKDFKIIRGYYFNEGFNKKINIVMAKLFNERLKKKKENNPIQETYKLIMNSAYGKTIQKPIDTENKFIKTEKKFKKHLYFNSMTIKSFQEVYNLDQTFKQKKFIVKHIKTINDHFSLPQVGVQVLSMSKRIMNEVMCLSEDLKLKIFYQDTDSMHIREKDIDKLSEEYKKLYNKDLIGKQTGQFHSDFDDKIKNEDGEIIGKYLKVFAIESYFLGKKCYIDKLVKIDNDNNEYIGYHIRMKGVPSDSIELYEEDNMEIYNKLINEEEIEFNLLANPLKVRMEFNDDYTIENRTKFFRKIYFKGDYLKVYT